MPPEDTITSGEGQNGAGGGSAEDTLKADVAADTVVAIEGHDTLESGTAEPDPITQPPVVIEPTVVVSPVIPIKSDAQKRLEELDAKIDDEYFNFNSIEGKAVLKEHSRVAARVVAEPIQQKLHTATVFTGYAQEYDIPEKDCIAIWKDVQKTISPKFRGDSSAETYEFVKRLEAHKAVPVPDKPKPKPVATPVIAPGQVLPRGVGSVPPQPVAADSRTIEERLRAGDKETILQFKGAYEDFFSRK